MDDRSSNTNPYGKPDVDIYSFQDTYRINILQGWMITTELLKSSLAPTMQKGKYQK